MRLANYPKDQPVQKLHKLPLGDVKKGTFIPESLFSKEGDISLRTFCMNVPLPDADYFREKTFRKVFK